MKLVAPTKSALKHYSFRRDITKTFDCIYTKDTVVPYNKPPYSLYRERLIFEAILGRSQSIPHNRVFKLFLIPPVCRPDVYVAMSSTSAHVSFLFVLNPFKPAPEPFKFILDSPVISSNKIMSRNKFTAPLAYAWFSNMGADLFFGHTDSDIFNHIF